MSMEMKFYKGSIEGRGHGVVIKFEYSAEIVADLKFTIKKYRYYYTAMTGRMNAAAGGWFPELKVWYVDRVIWQMVQNDLLLQGYQLIQLYDIHDLLADDNGSSNRTDDNYYRSRQSSSGSSSSNLSAEDYKLLGLNTGASQQQIKEAYRDLVQIWHPDRFANNERLRTRAEEQMKLINAAYERLRFAA